jgi:hypothetical protein
MNHHEESTYALLVRSEEKSRSVLETIAYVVFILSVFVAMWEFVHHPVKIPASGIECVVCQSATVPANSPG